MTNRTLTLPARTGARLSPDDLQARVSRALQVPNPPDNSAALLIERECQIQLRVTDIDPYDRNPRTSSNALYWDIKESIRSARVVSPLKVSKRPGSTRFMVSAGGNTRLRALRELWEETKDPKYEFLLVTYQPWVGESSVLVAHLVENELHAPMCFWDKAAGVMALKALLEEEHGGSLSLRALHERLREQGLPVSVALLSSYSFALDQLGDLGDARQELSLRLVRELSPRFSFYERYLSAHARTSDEWLTLRRQVLQRIGEEWQQCRRQRDIEPEPSVEAHRAFDLDSIVTEFEHAIAQALSHSPAKISAAAQLVREMPDAKLTDVLHGIDDSVVVATTTRPVASQSSRRKPAPLESDLDRVPASAHTPADAARSQPGGASDPLTALGASVAAFAQAGCIEDLVHTYPAMPCGFYVELPASNAPLDMDHRQERYWSWWLAATLADQLAGHYAHRMPEHSQWRQCQLQSVGLGAADLHCQLDVRVGVAPSLDDLGRWLTQCPPHLFDRYHALLTALRTVRTSHPERFYVDEERA